MKLNGRLILFTVFLIVLATACKFFFGPDLDWSGFSPVIAIALFSGFMIPNRGYSFLIPLLALLISDVAIQVLYNIGEFPYAGFYEGQWKNYLILFSTTLLGWLLKGRSTFSLIAGAAVAPTVFFLLSNFSVWIGFDHAMYPRTFSGLLSSYTAGLPFYKNALIACVIFLPVILLSYNFITKEKARLTIA